MIVIKLPGTPRNIKVTQAIDANVKSAGGYPWNSLPSDT